ncbi:hypothetical protein KEJ28_02725, partial [Candidatus Bathyarchaeota archaeon]|nr:hypothetical protein [Candidatus Bathyarchaeota archaeon]
VRSLRWNERSICRGRRSDA